MNERRIHRIFEISILLKGAHALIECVGGLVLAFVSTSTIARLVNALTQEELIEDPNDFVVVVANFTPVPREGYRLGVPVGGLYRNTSFKPGPGFYR